MAAVKPLDFTRLAQQHRQALRDQRLVWWGVALVIACPLIALAGSLAVWGWPR